MLILQKLIVLSMLIYVYFHLKFSDIGIGGGSGLMSVAEQQSSDLRQAKEDVDRALSLFRGSKLWNGVGNALRVRGRIHMSLGNRKSARTDLETAHQIFSILQNHRGDAATLQLLGNLKAQISDYLGAERDLEEALQKSRDLKDEKSEGSCLRSLGEVYFNQGKLDLALKFLKLATDKVDENNKREKAYILRSLGEVQVRLGDMSNGLANLEASIPLFR